LITSLAQSIFGIRCADLRVGIDCRPSRANIARNIVDETATRRQMKIVYNVRLNAVSYDHFVPHADLPLGQLIALGSQK
jgi:hypothetical protein